MGQTRRFRATLDESGPPPITDIRCQRLIIIGLDLTVRRCRTARSRRRFSQPGGGFLADQQRLRKRCGADLLVKRGGSNLTELTSGANDGGANDGGANSADASHGASAPQSSACRTVPEPPPRRD